LKDEPNWQGPAPFSDKSNVALQLFAFADTPYDSKSGCASCNTCIAEDGITKEEDCTRFDCILANSTLSELPDDNTCTFEGKDYECVEETLIPYMNSQIAAGDAALILHAGDILGGAKPLIPGGMKTGLNTRCQSHSFGSRRELFSTGENFLLLPGDNDWNECVGYDINSNSDPIRQLWRDYFANAASPLNQFGRDFPPTLGFPGGTRPHIDRKDTNPELFYFSHNKIALIGLNQVNGPAYIDGTDINEDWVEESLGLDTSCELESIVILSHRIPEQTVYDRIDSYFAGCGGSHLPILTITGDKHPPDYCMTRANNRLHLMVEAFQSGPIKVSVVRDPEGLEGDFFHVEDTQPEKWGCPDLL